MSLNKYLIFSDSKIQQKKMEIRNGAVIKEPNVLRYTFKITW